MKHIIGVDFGTSSVKCVAFDLKGRIRNKVSRSYSITSPEPGAQEQDPEEILSSFFESFADLTGKIEGSVLGIGLSCFMHSLIVTNGKLNPLTKSFSWADTRARNIAEAVKYTPLGTALYEKTGLPVHPMGPVYKIAWLKKERPGIFQKAGKFIDLKTLLLYRLTGELLTDHSLASATGLMNLRQRSWLDTALQFAGIKPSQLPELAPTDAIIHSIKPAMARRLGILPGTPIVIGASDGCLANLGAMSLDKNSTVVTVGSSGAVRKTTDTPFVDKQQRLFNYWLTEGMYITGGATNNGGLVLKWFREEWAPEKSIPELLAEAARTPAGPEQPLFLPYLLGERAPIWDAGATGAFLGIRKAHGRADFTRALVEGICLNLLQIAAAIDEVDSPSRSIIANGGFMQSDFTVQVLADIFQKPVHIRGSEEGTAFGAALMAMKALGVITDFREMESAVPVSKTFEPGEENRRHYRSLFQVYKNLYPALKGLSDG